MQFFPVQAGLPSNPAPGLQFEVPRVHSAVESAWTSVEIEILMEAAAAYPQQWTYISQDHFWGRRTPAQLAAMFEKISSQKGSSSSGPEVKQALKDSLEDFIERSPEEIDIEKEWTFPIPAHPPKPLEQS